MDSESTNESTETSIPTLKIDRPSAHVVVLVLRGEEEEARFDHARHPGQFGEGALFGASPWRQVAKAAQAIVTNLISCGRQPRVDQDGRPTSTIGCILVFSNVHIFSTI